MFRQHAREWKGMLLVLVALTGGGCGKSDSPAEQASAVEQPDPAQPISGISRGFPGDSRGFPGHKPIFAKASRLTSGLERRAWGYRTATGMETSDAVEGPGNRFMSPEHPGTLPGTLDFFIVKTVLPAGYLAFGWPPAYVGGDSDLRNTSYVSLSLADTAADYPYDVGHEAGRMLLDYTTYHPGQYNLMNSSARTPDAIECEKRLTPYQHATTRTAPGNALLKQK